MNIKVPKGMNSPTVVIIGQGTMKPEKNDMTAKCMDNLERKLDQQYKVITDKTEYVKLIERLQKAFMDKLERIIVSNNSSKNIYEKRIEGLRKDFSNRISEFKSNSNNDNILKSFVRKLGSLENSIKNISVSQPVKVIRTGVSLNGAFERMFERLEKAIKDARPRVFPSPS